MRYLLVAWAMTMLCIAQAHGADLPAQTLDIFQQRCAACHGTQVEKPKGRFGFINDLPRLAADPDYVVPGKPDDSGVWQTIDAGDMPPADSPHGQLTQIEKDTIHQWIAEGAKLPESEKPTAAQSVAAPMFSVGRFITFIGRFHPVIVHFPIALVFAALAAEVLRKQQAAKICLTFGAIGAIIAAALGWALWLHTTIIGSRELTMDLHQWVGSAMAVWVAMTWWLHPRNSSGTRRRYAYMAALVISAVGIGLVGHWGGLLVWGLNYYHW